MTFSLSYYVPKAVTVQLDLTIVSDLTKILVRS